MLGAHTARYWSQTKSTIALRSGEAGGSGIGSGIADVFRFQCLARDMGWKLSLAVHSDATAAIRIARRWGMGKSETC